MIFEREGDRLVCVSHRHAPGVAALQWCGPLGRLLAPLNDGLCESYESYMFVTLTVGYMDRERTRGVLACGGHDAPIVREPGGATAPLVVQGGPALGLLPGAQFPETELRLAPGAGMLGYTDGVTEARDGDGQRSGQARLLATVAAASNVPEDVGWEVVDAVLELMSGHEHSEDIAVLALQ